MVDFRKSDPAEADFWNQRYAACFAPWDAGRVPARLRQFVECDPSPRRVLVPGCGSAWDVRFLAESGWDVVGIDFSPEAVAQARAILGPHAGRVVEGDFFAPQAGAPFDLVYERALLCALPRRRWRDWGTRMGELVRPAGLLAGFFYFDATGSKPERGPPFPMHSQQELDQLLDRDFVRIEDVAVEDSIDIFKGKERWQVWRRKDP